MHHHPLSVLVVRIILFEFLSLPSCSSVSRFFFSSPHSQSFHFSSNIFILHACSTSNIREYIYTYMPFISARGWGHWFVCVRVICIRNRNSFYHLYLHIEPCVVLLSFCIIDIVSLRKEFLFNFYRPYCWRRETSFFNAVPLICRSSTSQKYRRYTALMRYIYLYLVYLADHCGLIAFSGDGGQLCASSWLCDYSRSFRTAL